MCDRGMAAVILPRRSEPARTLKCGGGLTMPEPREPAPVALAGRPRRAPWEVLCPRQARGRASPRPRRRRSSSSWSPRTGPRRAPCVACCSAPASASPPTRAVAEAAEAAVVAHQPDAVLLDLAPDSGGIEAIERIMGTRPTPIVVCGEMAPHCAATRWPPAPSTCRRPGRVADAHRSTPARSSATCGSPAGPGHHPSAQPAARPRPARQRQGADSCSLPRPGAVHAEVPAGIRVDRHRRLDRRAACARDDPRRAARRPARAGARRPAHGRRLRRGPGHAGSTALSPLPVVMATHARRLAPGTVHVAPAGMNTVLRRGLRVELRTPPEGQFHVPGVDAAFTSAAATCGARRHRRAAHRHGSRRCGRTAHACATRAALTIGQDEPTSVVWGMPAAAQALGAVECELPLPAASPRPSSAGCAQPRD